MKRWFQTLGGYCTEWCRAFSAEFFSRSNGEFSPEVVPRSRSVKKQNRAKDQLGVRGEKLASDRLRQAGYKILERNIILDGCEIDLIAEDTGTTVFVEVKTRSGLRFGDPADAVDDQRRRRMIRASRAWRRWRRDWESPIRFDIVAILWPDGEEPEYCHLIGAFDERFFS